MNVGSVSSSGGTKCGAGAEGTGVVADVGVDGMEGAASIVGEFGSGRVSGCAQQSCVPKS